MPNLKLIKLLIFGNAVPLLVRACNIYGEFYFLHKMVHRASECIYMYVGANPLHRGGWTVPDCHESVLQYEKGFKNALKCQAKNIDKSQTRSMEVHES